MLRIVSDVKRETKPFQWFDQLTMALVRCVTEMGFGGGTLGSGLDKSTIDQRASRKPRKIFAEPSEELRAS
jgi:hypothetical protein